MRGSFRHLTYGLITLLLVVVLIELLSFAFFSLFRERFTFHDMELYRVDPAYLERAAERFHPRFGWTEGYATPLGQRPARQYGGAPLIATYGDSYTHCDEVADDETWQAILAEAIRRDVDNFGVGGFGTGQAYLRFRDEFALTGAKVAVLGFIGENINRSVNVFRPFYFPVTQLRLTKPRFVLRDGELRLLENPIQRVEDLPRLSDEAFLRRLGPDDWWFNRDAYPRFGFPFTAILMNKRIWLEALQGQRDQPTSDANARPWDSLWNEPAPRDLMFALFEAFTRDARGQGAVPLILLLPHREDVDYHLAHGRAPAYVDRVMEVCASRGDACLEMVSVFAQAVESGQVDSIDMLYRRFHASPEGNRLIAARLHAWLRAEGLVENRSVRQGPRGASM